MDNIPTGPFPFLLINILPITILIVILVVILRALRFKGRHNRRYDSDDARTMQEINRGLQRMEDRIEALETLLMDRPERSRPRREAPRGE
ncbi:MAG: hypothetical protein QGD90_07080 [Candidatus Hydrogenedentes bacterium]|nr:hypothetical protein [Candidatus Hydrogenedentota bacterium]